jgi:large subunit ribosomal protein L30
MTAKTITIKQKKSVIGSNDKVRDTVRGLGLKGPGTHSTLENTPPVRGMIKKVIHLLDIVEEK